MLNVVFMKNHFSKDLGFTEPRSLNFSKEHINSVRENFPHPIVSCRI